MHFVTIFISLFFCMHKESAQFNEDSDWFLHQVHLITQEMIYKRSKRSTTHFCHAIFFESSSLLLICLLFIALSLATFIVIVYFHNEIVHAITLVFIIISLSTKSP